MSIFDPDGAVIFDGAINPLEMRDYDELYGMEPADFISRESKIPRTNGIPSVSTAFDLPAGSLILAHPLRFEGYQGSIELVPAPRASERPEIAFVPTAGNIINPPSENITVVGEDVDPGVYTLTSVDGINFFGVDLRGTGEIQFQRVDQGDRTPPFYLPQGGLLYISGLTNSPGSMVHEPAEPVPFEGGELDGRMLLVGTDIEPGTWTVSGTRGMFDTYDADGELVNRVPVVRGHEIAVELEEGQFVVDSDYIGLSSLSLDR